MAESKHRTASHGAPLRIAVKVVPGASRDGIVGWLGDRLKVRVRAQARRGEANAAVCRLIAGSLGVPSRQVRVVAGHGQSDKLLVVEGVPAERIRALEGR